MMPPRLRCLGAGIGALAIAVGLLSARRAQAQESRFRLDWSAPLPCPDLAFVVGETTRILGRAKLSEAPGIESVSARAVVTRTANGLWSVAVRTQIGGVDGGRKLTGPSCDAVAKATALIVALAVDPDAAMRAPDPDDGPPPGRPPIATTEPPPRASPAAVPTGQPLHHLGFTTSLAWNLGVLPSLGVATAWALAWMPGRLRVEGEASVWATQNASLAGDPGQGGRFALVTGGARVCYALWQRVFELAPCAAFEVERVSATGTGAAVNLHADSVWELTGGSVLAGVRISRELALRASFDILVPIERPLFVVEGAGSVYQIGHIEGRGGLGLELRIF